MKRTYEINVNGKAVQRTENYIPFRYIVSVFLILFEVLAVLAIVTLLYIYVPYFFIAVIITQIACALTVINSDDNPDYKIPWLIFVICVHVVGFMCYFMFYKRNLTPKQRKKLTALQNIDTRTDDGEARRVLKELSPLACSQAEIIAKLASAHLYRNTEIGYFPLGELMFAAMLGDLNRAEEFIFMEYFIIEEGEFWNSILEVLKRKAADGVDVRVIYDDIGCMNTLPGNYYKTLRKCGIKCVPFSILRGQANNEFNNRSHRKITVIDGKVAYTGGVNIADEYINKKVRFGHWKDAGVRLEGEAVNEFTRMFLMHYGLNAKKPEAQPERFMRRRSVANDGFCVPFGDGPKPMFGRQVAKTAILNLLAQAERYVYMTSPYLIIDNELTQAIENAALRGVDVRIVTPHIPDKKTIFRITRSSYLRFLNAGVKIYEYEPGFLHAKTYLADGNCAVVGTTNLDYRSLVHHFENGVWIYRHRVVEQIERDVNETIEKSILIGKSMCKDNLFRRFMRALVKVFTPLL